MVTESSWFLVSRVFRQNVIAQTDPVMGRNEIAESVLSLSYEIEHPQTLLKGDEAKGAISEENYVSIDGVWNRVSYYSTSGDLLFTQDGAAHQVWLSNLSKQMMFENQNAPTKFNFIFSNRI